MRADQASIVVLAVAPGVAVGGWALISVGTIPSGVVVPLSNRAPA